LHLIFVNNWIFPNQKSIKRASLSYPWKRCQHTTSGLAKLGVK